VISPWPQARQEDRHQIRERNNQCQSDLCVKGVDTGYSPPITLRLPLVLNSAVSGPLFSWNLGDFLLT
jgi:hypothetical protein